MKVQLNRIFALIPAHKNHDKQLVNNYRSVPLLSSFGKIFEKSISNKIYNFLLDKKPLNPNQPEFHLSDSCVNQLLAITHEVFQVFECLNLHGQMSFWRSVLEGIPQGLTLGLLLLLVCINDLPS